MSLIEPGGPSDVQVAAFDMIRAAYPDEHIMRTLDIDFGTLREFKTAYGHMQRAEIFRQLRQGRTRDEITVAFPGTAPDRIDGYIAEHQEGQRNEVFRLIAAGQTDADITARTGYRADELTGLRAEYAAQQRENAYLLIRRALPPDTICAQLAITAAELEALQTDYPAWLAARTEGQADARPRR